MGSVTTTAGGQDAINVLARRLHELRSGSPLDPALVICPSAVVAVGLRRSLGRATGGVAGVRTVTVSGFVDELLRPALVATGRHIAAKAELLVAIRQELLAEPGAFGAVANHRTTDERLLAFQQELVGVESGPLALLAAEAEGLSVDALRVVTAAVDRPGVGLSGHRLVDVVARELEQVPAGALGPIVVYQPEPLRPYDARILNLLAARPDVEVHLALTGHDDVDRGYIDRLAGWGLPVDGQARTGGVVAPRAASLVEVADPDEEVRAAIRLLSAQTTVGVDLSDTAIVYTEAEPYASMIFDQLDAAGLPHGGPGYRPLTESLAGRTLRRLLALALQGLDRASMVTLWSSGPIDDGTGVEVPATEWDRLSRQAGVIDDDHWTLRLEALSDTVEEGERPSLLAMAGFVSELRGRLAPPEPLTWSVLSRWAIDLLDRYLLLSPRWPDDEVVARDRLRSIVATLGSLDTLGPPGDLRAFEATVVAELSSVPMPGRPLGHGIHVGPLSSVVGLSFERICVVGPAEGRFPRSPREDPLLTDRLRSRAGLLEKSQVTAIDRRRLALAVAGSRRPAILLTARGDLRSTRSRAWPRDLDPMVESVTSIDSHHAGLIGHGRPASEEELELRSLIAHVAAGEPVGTHELASSDPVLAAGLARHTDRRQLGLGPHSGRVSANRVDPLDRPLSPTALETYARCPRRYLLERVLRIRENDRPERIAEITAIQRGNLVHRVLERFIGEMIASESVPEPDQPWSTDQRATLFEILEQELKAAESHGYTGGTVRTRLLHRQLLAWMDAFCDADDLLRARFRSTPVRVEFGFGFDDAPPVTEWNGRPMRLRGTVDRVDTTADGGVIVIDYKTGRGREFADLDDNPLKEGTRLQLPLYAQDMAKRLDRDGPMFGVYWLLSGGEVRAVEVGEDLEAALENVVGVILDGIGAGLFPGIPGETDTWKQTFTNCRYCDFERICPTDRQWEWAQVRHDRALEPIALIAEALDPTLEAFGAESSGDGPSGDELSGVGPGEE